MVVPTYAKRSGGGKTPFIVDGRYMTCPRCKKTQDILSYVPMAQIEEYQSETVPIYKCSECKWRFAPAQRFRIDD